MFTLHSDTTANRWTHTNHNSEARIYTFIEMTQISQTYVPVQLVVCVSATVGERKRVQVELFAQNIFADKDNMHEHYSCWHVVTRILRTTLSALKQSPLFQTVFFFIGIPNARGTICAQL